MAEESGALKLSDTSSIFDVDALIEEFQATVLPEAPVYIKTPNAITGKFGERASHYRTQKARGVHGIKRESFQHLQYRYGMVGRFPPTLYTLPHDGMELCKTLFAGPYQQAYFARPCPTVPRHGFVESRIVENREDLENLIQKTLKEDENGEVLIMPVLSGIFSAVANNAGITWGHGHDGVTGGYYNVSIPCPVPDAVWAEKLYPGNSFYDVYQEDFSGNVPYIELVEHGGTIVPVQVRAGPPLPVSKNFVPRETVVKQYLKPSIHSQNTHALLQWEKQVKRALAENGGPEGLVVWYPNMSLSSHWAIHAIQHDIAVWAEKDPPTVGETLPLQSEVPTPLNTADLQRLSTYITRAQEYSISDFEARDVILTAMAASHAMSFWDNSSHLLRLRACAVEFITRFVVAACIGEARHFYYTGPGQIRRFKDYHCPEEFSSREAYREAEKDWINQRPRNESNLPWNDVFGKHSKHGIERSQIYEKMLTPYGLADRAKLTKLAALDFRTPGWGYVDKDSDPDDVNCSYGGPKWARVCDAVIDVIDATSHFQEKPTRGRWTKLVARVNYAAHVAHNGGGVLGKWLRNEALNCVAMRPTYGFMNYFTAHICLNSFRSKPGEE